ncbi:MAG: riboflavin synthase [Rhodothermaceae bacterium]|nr:riboflavin synthase [Rhodothermaceae bacterium]
MFTGIIEAIGSVEAVAELEGGRRFHIAAPFAGELRVDESVAVNGTCLTVVAHDAATFEAIAIEETLAKTSLGDLQAGSLVNLERAMRAGGRLDGHIVQGHVDATGTVDSIEALDDSWLVRVRYPETFAPYLIPVGSIALDGISLTVARLDDDALTAAIIPHTWTHTTVHTWQPGRRVNLEFDLIGKYVVRALERGVGPVAS